MSQYTQFSSSISLYPQQVSQELMAAFVVGKQYMQDVSDKCRLAIVPEDISISRHSLIASLYYYISQYPSIHRIVVISSDPRVTAVTLPSHDYDGIRYVLGQKIMYDADIAERIESIKDISINYDDLSLQSEARYTHAHYIAMLPQECHVLPVILPLGDISSLPSLVDILRDDPQTMIILMDTFAFRPYTDDAGQQDMQTLVYEPGGEILRFFNQYAAAQSYIFYALRVDKSPVTSDSERYTSILMAG